MVSNQKWVMMARVRYIDCFSVKICVSDMHLYVVWVSTYFFIINICPGLSSDFFSFLNQVSASLIKAQIPLKIGDP